MSLPIGSLLPADSPRFAGSNIDHVRALAESDLPLPPIVVHRGTMRVVDGMHRLRAAVLRGGDTIDVRFFDGSPADAFVFAVRANTDHGLPLSLAERVAAATRVIGSHPQWSDRVIASATGLAPNTIGRLRGCATVQVAHLNHRIGRDGRIRPVDSAPGRTLAASLLIEHPGASLREIARLAKISPNTVRDVRNRLGRGEPPVPDRGRDAATSAARSDHAPVTSARAVRRSTEERAVVLRNLRRDPSLRLNEAGRVLLRLLDALLIDTKEWERLGSSVPAHWVELVLGLATECAAVWQEFADQLEAKYPNAERLVPLTGDNRRRPTA